MSFNHLKQNCPNSACRDDDEEDGEKAAKRQNNRSMLSYFSAPAEGEKSHQTHRFFSDRRLKSLNSLWRRSAHSYVEYLKLIVCGWGVYLYSQTLLQSKE